MNKGNGWAWVAVVAAVLIAVGAIAGAVVYRTGDTASASPTQVVSDYLHALAAGDADAALALSAASPGSTRLLTSEVLRKQLEKLPITDIRVEGEQPDLTANADRVYVKASASFGTKHSEGSIRVVRTNDSWKLASAFLVLQPTAVGRPAASTLTVFGVGVDPDAIDVFPGALSVATSNPFLDVSQRPPLLLDRMHFGEQTNSFDVAFAVNEAGKRAIGQAVVSWLTGCMTPGAPAAGPCDKVDETLTRAGIWQAGSARLTGPIDLGQFTVSLAQALRAVAICNFATVPFVAQRPDGSTLPGNLAAFTTTVDLGQNPPVVVGS